MPDRAPANASTLGPDLEFEQLLDQLVGRAGHLTRSHRRLRDLVRVNNDITSNLDLQTLLRTIVEIGTELIEARYGAMGVVGDDRSMQQFITVGMDDETIALVGELPEGKGLLGALIDDPEPVRLSEITSDARSSGFPEHHPPMRSFLGVPIRVRGEVYGNLYLTDSTNGAFSADDEELAVSLAATAGIAIANARLYEESRFRESWASALAETARRLMRDEDDEHLGFLIERVKELGDADLVLIARVGTGGHDLLVDHATGLGAADLAGSSVPVDRSFCGEAIRTGAPVAVPDLSEAPTLGGGALDVLGPVLAVPFSVGGVVGGVLAVARRRGRAGFGARDVEMGRSFAAHVSVVVDRAETRMMRQRVALLEDRDRIARDLHDHVIQGLYATGLSLQAVAVGLPPGAAAEVVAQIAEIDTSIAQIRQSIFALHRGTQTTAVSVRARVLEIVERLEAPGPRPTTPRVVFLGPVDLMVDAALTDDVAAVVTEGLANAARHGMADAIDVVVSAASGRVTVEVADDGVGLGESSRRSGLDNLRARAVRRAGSFELLSAPGDGTRLVWSVPV